MPRGERDRPGSGIEEYALLGIGVAQLKLGGLEEARRCLFESLQIGCELGDRVGVVYTLEILAAVAAELGDADGAMRFVSVAASVREELGFAIHPLDLELLQPHFAKLDLELEAIGASAAGSIRLEDVIELALAASAT